MIHFVSMIKQFNPPTCMRQYSNRKRDNRGRNCIMARNDNYSVKQEIKKAFLALMAQKPYMDITVTDIVNTAQVARASFYRNFESISNVIDMVVDDMTEEFIEDVFPVISGSDERKWREFLFEYFYRFIQNQKKLEPFRFQNESVFFSRSEEKMKLWDKEMSADTMQGKYAACGKMGLINSIARKWMDDGMKETPEEMIDYIMSFIISF